jgi:acetyl-CoA acetyltransferase
MLNKIYIPYKGYWSSPFCRWQGSLQNENAIVCGAATAKRFFESRDIAPDFYDGLVLGMTINQQYQFFSTPYFATLMGNEKIGGPILAHACATSATSIGHAAAFVESGFNECFFVATTDRMSNLPSIIWPNPLGLGGTPVIERFFADYMMAEPVAEVSAGMTAELVAKENGISREECDAMVLRRYEQYLDSTANERDFQKRYMFPVEIRIGRKKTRLIEEDEGITPRNEEDVRKARAVFPEGVLTTMTQTHPADANAGMIVTTKEKAAELSSDKGVTIQLLSYGAYRTEKARMPAAVTPCAEITLKNAGIKVGDLAAVKTHNPFAVNDVLMGKLMKIDDKIFNNYGSSIIFGHPQGPTGMRCIVELIEELVLKGGGYGLFAGCAAGDSAAGVVIKVS